MVTGRCSPSDRTASWAIRSVLRDINGSYQCRGLRSSFSKFEGPISAWNFGIRLSSLSGLGASGSGGKDEAHFSFGKSPRGRSPRVHVRGASVGRSAGVGGGGARDLHTAVALS